MNCGRRKKRVGNVLVAAVDCLSYTVQYTTNTKHATELVGGGATGFCIEFCGPSLSLCVSTPCLSPTELSFFLLGETAGWTWQSKLGHHRGWEKGKRNDAHAKKAGNESSDQAGWLAAVARPGSKQHAPRKREKRNGRVESSVAAVLCCAVLLLLLLLLLSPSLL